jgi:hypothetical protein
VSRCVGQTMSTYLTLEDGRILGTSNGTFDAIVELATSELKRRPDSLPGLAEWLLEQRCEVQGPGVGYLDLRELSPRAAREFKAAFETAYDIADLTDIPDALRAQFTLLREMWDSIARGEPPEALTSPHWSRTVASGKCRGPGW